MKVSEEWKRAFLFKRHPPKRFYCEPKYYVSQLAIAASATASVNIAITNLLYAFVVRCRIFKTADGTAPTFPVGLKIGATQRDPWVSDLIASDLITGVPVQSLAASNADYSWDLPRECAENTQITVNYDNSSFASACTAHLVIGGIQVMPRQMEAQFEA